MLRTVVACCCVLLLSVVTAAHTSSSSSYTYEQYLHDQGKTALRAQESKLSQALRKTIFENELRDVIAHNAKKNVLFKREVNRFSDWTQEEKDNLFLFQNRLASLPVEESSFLKERRNSKAVPKRQAFDWREVTSPTPVVTTVKDQGMCGSCWAHATTEVIESLSAINTGNQFVLSQQQFVSCVPNVTAIFSFNGTNYTDVMGGCRGYFPHHAMQVMAENPWFYGAITQEWMNPYKSYWDQVPAPDKNLLPQFKTPTCDTWMRDVVQHAAVLTNVTGYQFVTPNDEVAMEDALINRGPVAVVMAVYQDFFTYKSGIYKSDACEGKKGMMPPSHAVNLVGFGYDAGLEAHYWILRNSWSAGWGENGYARMHRPAPGDPLVCGKMLLPANMSQVDKDWVTQESCGMCGILGYAVQPTL